MQQTEVLTEDVVHQRYLTVYNRRVKFSHTEEEASSNNLPEAKVLDFDIVGHPKANFSFAVALPYHTKSATVTVLREYAQGPNAIMYCLPTGAFDPNRHKDLQACAQSELSEEAMLAGGEWHQLVPEGHPGLAGEL